MEEVVRRGIYTMISEAALALIEERLLTPLMKWILP